jgi:D-glycero-D-manno-heptose 1,7-bisphosphate phosphatase
MKRAFFLDRDGVIIKSKLRDLVPRPPATVEEVEVIEGVAFSIQYLKANDFLPVVVTNQPDVARGITTEEKVNDIHEYLRIETSLEHFYTCFHDEQDKCLCRKPLTGLIDQAANDLNIDVSKSYLIGDRWRDIAAGNSA